ncbi:MAG: DUF4340 domain-containing protein [bacterium]
MKFKKTLFLFIFLALLVIVAYLLERPKDNNQPLSLFPEFSMDTAALVDIHNKGENVVLAKVDKGWKIGDEKGFPADPELVKKALESIKELKKANNIVSRNPENQNLYEVDPNKGIEVKVTDGNKKPLANFLVGKTGPDFMSTYLRKAGSQEVLLCDGYHLRSMFSRTTKNWYDLNVCTFTPEEISKIEIVEGDKKLTLKKENDNWQLTDPNQAPAKKNLVDDMTNTLSRLRAIDLAVEETEKLAEYELSPPAKQITVALSDGTEKKIMVGKKNDKNQYYVKADKDVLYLVSQFNISKLSKTFDELKEVKDEAKDEQNEGGHPTTSAMPPGMMPQGAIPQGVMPQGAVVPGSEAKPQGSAPANIPLKTPAQPKAPMPPEMPPPKKPGTK